MLCSRPFSSRPSQVSWPSPTSTFLGNGTAPQVPKIYTMFYCCQNKLPRTGWPKTTDMYSPGSEVSVGQKLGGLWLSRLLRAQGQNQGIFLAGNSGGRIRFQLTQAVGENQLLVVVALRSPSPCWLSAGAGLPPLFLLPLSLRPVSQRKRSPSQDWNLCFHPLP